MPRKIIKRRSSLKKKKTVAPKRVSFSDDLKSRGRSGLLRARKSITRKRGSVLKKKTSSSNRCPPIPTSAQAQEYAKETVANLKAVYGSGSAMFRCKGALIAALLQRDSGVTPKVAVQVAGQVAPIPNPAEVAKQLSIHPPMPSQLPPISEPAPTKWAKEKVDERMWDPNQALVPVADSKNYDSDYDELDQDTTECDDLKRFFGKDDPKTILRESHPDKYCSNLSGDDQSQCKKEQDKNWRQIKGRYDRLKSGKCRSSKVKQD